MRQSEFSGGVFSEELPTGRSGARITLSAAGLCAQTPHRRFDIAYADCAVEQGGASGRMIFCRNPDRSLTIFSEQRGFAEALERAGGRGLREAVGRLRAAQARRQNKERALLLGGALALVLLAWGGYHAVRALGRAALLAMPLSVDRRLGDLAYASMERRGPLVRDPVVTGAVDEIVGRLQRGWGGTGLDFRAAVVDAPVQNAYCLPGGRIVVFTGLLRLAQGPEQVAGVLSHEMAHAIERHGLSRLAQSAGIIGMAQLLIGDVGGLTAVVVQLAKEGVLTSYGRDQETEADLEGLRVLRGAHLDGRGLEEFFALMQREQGSELPESLAWLSSHPQLAERRERLRQRRAELGPAPVDPLDIDWRRVMRHLGGSPAALAEPGPTSE